MRLRGVRIDRFKSITDQGFTIDGMVVLFGANGVGKTNVLEAVGTMAGDSRTPVRDSEWRVLPMPVFGGPEAFEMLPWFTDADGALLIELDGADIPGHRERTILDQFHLGQRGESSFCRWLDPEDRQRLGEEANAAEMRALVAEEAAGTDAVSSPHRVGLASQLLDTNLLLIEFSDTSLLATPHHVDQQTLEAVASEVPSTTEPEDDLSQIARQLLEGRQTVVDHVGEGWGDGDPLLRVRTFRSEPGSIRADVEAAVDDLLVRLEGRRLDAGSGVSHWLKVIDVDVDADRTFARVSPDPNAPLRIRPLIGALVSALERRTNELAPPFITEQGEIVCRLMSPVVWDTAGRIGVHLRVGDDTEIPVELLGSGTARWMAASVRLAIDDLLDGEWLLRPGGDAGGRDVDASQEAGEGRDAESVLRWPAHGSGTTPGWSSVHDDELRAAASAGTLADRLEVDPPDQLGAVFLVDEPEAHLHPAAVAGIAKWLSQLASRSAAVMVASHSRAFLELPSRDASLVAVRREGSRTTLTPVPDEGVGALDGFAKDVGLSRADLLQLHRTVLFVEGPHDEQVLTEMAGSDLRRARVLVVPIHGIDNALALVDSEIVHHLGLRVAVLADNLGKGHRTGREREATDRLRREAKAAGRSIKVFGIAKPDIVEYLADEACREAAPDFPGWRRAVEEWNAKRRPTDFKRFVTSSYGLDLRRFEVGRLAARTVELRGVPPEIAKLVGEITAFAS